MGKLINTKIIYMVTDFLHIYNIGKIYIYNIGKHIYLILGKILDILFATKIKTNVIFIIKTNDNKIYNDDNYKIVL